MNRSNIMPARFVALVRSFPVLLNYAPGVYETIIDLTLLDSWASHDKSEHDIERIVSEGKAPFPGDGARCAARFVLNLWSNRKEWKCGKFDIFDALIHWDDRQIKAWQAWAANPWRP